MKIPVRKLTLSLSLSCKQIRRLCRCLRSKVSSLRSQVRIPKGCLAIHVGKEQKRFVIPILYLYHPFISKLLVEAGKEFGYNYQGPLIIPCEIHDFQQLARLIDREKKSMI
ncbi:hypothetical protein SUGI_0629890 [Cryptomeria japonica]|nr:hypothetical protein SUGI_0629890 [Cryptomeria japonica]